MDFFRSSNEGEILTEPAWDAQRVGRRGILVLFAYFAVAVVALIGVLAAIWPPAACFRDELSDRIEACDRTEIETKLILIMALAGALGGYIHSLTSFTDYVGNRELVRSWVYWLLLRAPIGALLAVLVYLLLRGGLVLPSTDDPNLNPYGFAGIAALVGMFSKQATDKLREIFDTIFRSAHVPERKDELKGAGAEPAVVPTVPKIAAVEPNTLRVNTTDLNLKIIGEGFTSRTVAFVDKSPRDVKHESESILVLQLAPQDVAATRSLSIAVGDPDNLDIVSNTVQVAVAP